MTKKIFNFGLPRTGTTSFHNFMLICGFNSVHTNDGFINIIYPHDYNNYINDIDMENNNIQKYINEYEVFSDLPWYSIKLRNKIIEKYSNDDNVIFVCTIRNKNEWINSIKKIIPCIISKAEKEFHNMEYDNSLIFFSHNIDKKLEEYYDKFYSSMDERVIKLWLNDTNEIKMKLSKILDDEKILDYDYPYVNS